MEDKLLYSMYASRCDACKEDKFCLLLKNNENRIKICKQCLDVIYEDLKQSERRFYGD